MFRGKIVCNAAPTIWTFISSKQCIDKSCPGRRIKNHSDRFCQELGLVINVIGMTAHISSVIKTCNCHLRPL